MSKAMQIWYTFEIKTLPVTWILDKDKRHWDYFQSKRLLSKWISSDKIFRGKKCKWFPVQVNPTCRQRGGSVLGPQGPLGWPSAFPGPSSMRSRGLHQFPMPSGVSCLSFQIVCPLAQRCESVAEAKMTGAISVSQFDVIPFILLQSW